MRRTIRQSLADLANEFDRAILARQSRVDPAVAQTVEYEVRTTVGINNWVFPAGVQINRIALRQQTSDFLLMPVVSDVDMTASYGHRGFPAFYQVRMTAYGLTVSLWPIPDAEYDLQVYAFGLNGPVIDCGAQYHDRHEKAFALLKQWLNAEQRKSLAQNNYFMVRGNKTGKLYRIAMGSVFNVAQLDADELPMRNLCFVPDNAPYPGDIMLAQKIMLETDEERALQIANKQPVLSDGSRSRGAFYSQQS